MAREVPITDLTARAQNTETLVTTEVLSMAKIVSRQHWVGATIGVTYSARHRHGAHRLGYVVFGRDWRRARERQTRCVENGEAVVAVRLAGRQAVVYFDSRSCRPALSETAQAAVCAAIECSGRGLFLGDVGVCSVRSVRAGHRLARYLVEVARTERHRLVGPPSPPGEAAND
jgi:hypothetical protein